MLPSVARWLGALLLAGAVSGCRVPGFYGQAFHGQTEILLKQRSLDRVLKADETEADRKMRLELVLELREFAERELNLPAGGHYLRYVELDRDYVLWNVFAAPRFSLEPREWRYPLVGRLSYRGYFDERMARRYAARLERRGYDVYVGGVEAYSTLGWFSDPVLSTFIENDKTDLAELIFHELAHQRLFVKGDTDFNESFATAVAREGVRRWLVAGGRTAELREYKADLQRDRSFIALLLELRANLESLYETADSWKQDGGWTAARKAELEARKKALIADLETSYEALRATWNGKANYDAWFDQPINNARLNTVATYFDLVPAFEALLARHDGDFETFFESVEKLGDLPRKERGRELSRLLKDGPQTAANSAGGGRSAGW